MVGVVDIEVRSEEFIRRPRRAELTSISCIGVSQVTASKRYVVLHILTTAHAARWAERDELNRLAIDELVADGCKWEVKRHHKKERGDTTHLGRAVRSPGMYMARADTSTATNRGDDMAASRRC